MENSELIWFKLQDWHLEAPFFETFDSDAVARPREDGYQPVDTTHTPWREGDEVKQLTKGGRTALRRIDFRKTAAFDPDAPGFDPAAYVRQRVEGDRPVEEATKEEAAE